MSHTAGQFTCPLMRTTRSLRFFMPTSNACSTDFISFRSNRSRVRQYVQNAPYNNAFKAPRLMRAAELIIPVEIFIFRTPSSLRNTTKVAIHGKNIARTTPVTTSCLALNPRGASMQRAISLRKKPMIQMGRQHLSVFPSSYSHKKSLTLTGLAGSSSLVSAKVPKIVRLKMRFHSRL